MIKNTKKIYSAGLVICLLNTYMPMQAFNLFEALLSIFSTSNPTQSTTSFNMLTERQAAEYVNNIIQSIERWVRPFTLDSELMKFKQTITNTIRNSSSAYQWTAYGKQYKKDIIDQFINSAILEYVEKQSYNYAYELTGNTTIAKKISESMRNNAMATLSQSNTINAERIAQYFGERLRAAVRDAVRNFEAPYQQSYNNYASSQPSYAPSAPPVENYPSTKCFFCEELFTKVPRIFLRPCGHDLCKQCCLDWFFKKHENACPQCMNTIDKDLLKQEISNTPWQTQQTTSSNTNTSSSSVATDPGNYDTTLYPSDECCICFDSFDLGNRVFMHPCGHDICKNCAKEWFFKQNKSTCPHCRTAVDKTKLERELSR